LVACVGRGVEWAQGLPDSVGCTATFSEDIDVGEQRLQLGVELEVFWTSSIDGYGVQSLPSINLTTPSDHMVVEVIGLGTPSSS